jgi:hyperosmotically inducible periplasmic protein
MRRMKALMSATLVALIATAAFAVPATASDRPDSWITLKTKLALMTTEGVDTWDLNVDTVGGAVTLHGKVATEAAKQKAETVARSIEGVKNVKNLLQVVPKAQREAVEERDDVIKERVEKAFKVDPTLNDSGISVASVNQGVVLLSGTTKSLESHLKAVEVVRNLAGVRRVSSEVKVEAQ